MIKINTKFVIFQPDQYQEKKQKAAAAEQRAKENQTNSSAAQNPPGGIDTTGGPKGSAKPVNLDEENISGPEDQSEASGVGDGHRFENLIKSMLARLELNNSLAPIQQYGRHQRKAANNRKKNLQQQTKKKAPAGEGGEDNQTTADGGANGASGDKGDKKEMQYDDKFYDLDDGWICDEDQGLQDDGVDQFINESESQSHMGSNIKGPNGEVLVDEEQRMRRHERKELERIAKRFKVITPQEFELNLRMAGEAAGTVRPQSDSWNGNNGVQNSGPNAGLSSNGTMQGVSAENGEGMMNDLPHQH